MKKLLVGFRPLAGLVFQNKAEKLVKCEEEELFPSPCGVSLSKPVPEVPLSMRLKTTVCGAD